MTLTIDQNALDLLYPAFVRTRPDGVIVAVGPSLARNCPTPLIGRDLFEAFRVERPARINSLASLLSYRGGVTLLVRDAPGLRLRGTTLSQGDIFLLVGYIPSVAENTDAPRLRVGDFAPSDGSLDIMLAAQMRLGLLEDAARLAEQLRLKSTEAEAAAQAKSRFLAIMSHEIRTPMNGVLAMTYALGRTELNPRQRALLAVINRSGDALMGIISDILDLSKIEAGKMEITEAPFDLAELVFGVQALYALKAREKGLRFRVELNAQGTFQGDAARLRQVLSNLVSNAIKFTDSGAVLLTADAAPDGDDSVLLRFVVADSGVGIASDVAARLFTPFTQGDASTTRTMGGTGLGLSIARELCARMGGDVRLESTPGVGSVFRCSVRVRPAGDAAAPIDVRADDDVLGALAGQSLRILVAEDNPTNQFVLGTLLEPTGAELIMTATGREALEAWLREPFDLVLMDMEMPEMNGLTAATEIRARERELGRARTPIAALTANVMTHQVARYSDSGIDACIGKPIEPRLLFETIARLVAPAAQAA